MEYPRHEHQLSLEEYQALELASNLRYEYHGGSHGYGEVFAMAGGEPKHNVIGGNALTALNILLREKDCTVFNSDQKVHINVERRFLYPDVSVVCGTIERSEKDTKAIINPLLIIEILSESTANYDRGDKFKFYSKIQSLQEYVLIEQNEPSVQVYYRASNTELWQITWHEGLEQILVLQSLNLSISLKDLYLKTENL